MCTTCGCTQAETRIEGKSVHPAHEPVIAHHHHADHPHDHSTSHRLVQLEQDILAKNNAYAERNRQGFAERGILALNLVSSPGAGKTTLLVRTIRELGGTPLCAVIEGDQQTDQDANRIRETGAPAVQVNTGKGCHLDGHMVGHAIERLDPAPDSVVFVENVGNLVCPAAFDLGEAHKVLIYSVTEGDDKPLKYPDMFHAADVMIVNKIDLAPYVDFDVDRAIENARRIHPEILVLRLSARTGEGMDDWLHWLRTEWQRTRQQRLAAPGR